MPALPTFVPNAPSSLGLRSRPLPRRAPNRPRRHFLTASTPSPPPSLSALAASVRSGETSAVALLESTLSRLYQVEPSVRAFLTVDAEAAHASAAAVDAAVAAGTDPGPLAGVPLAVKDNLCVRAQPTTAASALLDGFIAPYSATAVERLQRAGAVVLGKTNLDEFGMGSSTENSAYQPTRNPCDLAHVPGGSSGGSAAAVAARMCPVSLGSDTGGSIRLPASYCGVTGLKPSYGRVSRHGLLAYASSLDTVGPVCGSVKDAALVMQVMAGKDEMDATSVDAPVPLYADVLMSEPDLTGYTVGVIEEALAEGVHPDVAKSVRSAVDTLRELGATVKPVSIPKLSISTAAYYVLASSEASANLARYDGVRYGVRNMEARTSNELYAKSRAQGFGAEVKKRIMMGTYALSSGYYDAYYLRAQRVRALVAKHFKEAFAQGVDVLVSPVSPTPAFRIGEKSENPISMYLDDIMTIPASLAGLPALSVPCGMSGNLPIGMQITGPFLEEERVMQVGHAFQLATAHHLQTSRVVEDSLLSKV